VGSPADFFLEAESLAKRGFLSVLVLAPYAKQRSTPNPKRFENPEREIEIWNNTAEELSSHLDELANRFEVDWSESAAIGRNLGGSQLAHWLTKDSRIQNLLVAGAVPRLSLFWLESAHPAAVHARQQTTPQALSMYSEAMKPFDLATSLEKLQKRKMRLQFGRRDPWIEEIHLELPGEIVWLDDDHDMDSLHAREDRRAWIKRLI
jgi:hypothetical protein